MEVIHLKTLFQSFWTLFLNKKPLSCSVTHLGKVCWLWYQKENNWLWQIHSEGFPECWFVVLLGKQEKMVIRSGIKPEVGWLWVGAGF